MKASCQLPMASTYSYTQIKDEDTESQDGTVSPTHLKRSRTSVMLTCIGICLAFLFGSAVVFAFVINPSTSALTATTPSNSHIQFRQEWRSLSSEEKLEYISAVQCLRGKPSRVRSNQSLYDDFPWVHSQVGGYSHNSAAFLAWHRRFISLYEKALQEDCGYQGRLPYWDWTLDWQNITAAPVWHETLGFGDYGVRKDGPTFLNGHCVTTGPFADLEVLYVRGQRSKHCLSRGLVDADSPDMEGLANRIRPLAIAQVLEEDGYEQFNLRLEKTAHNSIPRMIRGDFSIFSAPYDPIFFLHHAQLDRLWFKWQQLHPQHLRDYAGLSARNSTTRASLQDKIPMGGLGPDLEVAAIMDTRNGLLSYVYI